MAKAISLENLTTYDTKIKEYITTKTPTKTSELTNDSDFITLTDSDDKYIAQDKLIQGDGVTITKDDTTGEITIASTGTTTVAYATDDEITALFS